MTLDRKPTIRTSDGPPRKLNAKEMSKALTAYLDKRGLNVRWGRRRAK